MAVLPRLKRGAAGADDPDAVRMTIGEHLDELRGCLVRSLVALVVACLVCIWPSKYLLDLLARPVLLALRAHGQPDTFLATHPTEALLIYIKVVVIFGLLLAGPYIIYQFWRFVAAGLYRHEKLWAYRLVPVSVGLFLAGAVFMYLFVLFLTLNFLIGFSRWLPMPDVKALPWEQLMLDTAAPPAPQTQPAIGATPPVTLVSADPPEPPTGGLWFNTHENKLKLKGEGQVYSVQLLPGGSASLVTTHFRLGEYIHFVFVMTIAFGVAFQMPLVVLFLARTGIVPVETFRSYRKVVILLIVIIAAFLAPPDLLSHMLLSGPMILLFELGLLLAARKPRTAPRRA